jgi:hypothetical protein
MRGTAPPSGPVGDAPTSLRVLRRNWTSQQIVHWPTLLVCLRKIRLRLRQVAPDHAEVGVPHEALQADQVDAVP